MPVPSRQEGYVSSSGRVSACLLVRRARLSLDLATLFYLNRMEADYRPRHRGLESSPLDRQVIARRYREVRLSTFSWRLLDLDVPA